MQQQHKEQQLISSYSAAFSSDLDLSKVVLTILDRFYSDSHLCCPDKLAFGLVVQL